MAVKYCPDWKGYLLLPSQPPRDSKLHAIAVESDPAMVALARKNLDAAGLLGTRVTVRVSGELTPAVEVEDVSAAYTPSWNPFEPGTLMLTYRLANAGNTLVTATDGSSAAGPFGAFAANPGPMLLPEVIPGSTVEVQREIGLAPWGWIAGSVTVHPEAIGLGAQELTAVAVPYSVAAVPWALLIAFALIAGAVVPVWLLLRRRGPRTDPEA